MSDQEQSPKVQHADSGGERGGTGREFAAERLLVVGSGAIAVMHLPFWMNWLQVNHPDVEVQIVLTRSAQQFVSNQGLTTQGTRKVLLDEWDGEPETFATHVWLAEWPDAVAVYPASMNFLTRLSLGLADTPAMIALQCTSAPIVVAPSLPPGARNNPVLTEHLERLSERENISVAPTQPVRSSSTGEQSESTVGLWDVLKLLEAKRRVLAGRDRE